MHYIKKLPYILAALITLIIGAVGIANGKEQRDIYIGMLVSIVVFLVVGFLLRSLVNNIFEENRLNNQKDALLEDEQGNILQNESNKGSKIDLKIDDSVEPDKYDEEFTPLKVSEVIRKKMKDE